jgi:hypothetical protein
MYTDEAKGRLPHPNSDKKRAETKKPNSPTAQAWGEEL